MQSEQVLQINYTNSELLETKQNQNVLFNEPEGVNCPPPQTCFKDSIAIKFLNCSSPVTGRCERYKALCLLT